MILTLYIHGIILVYQHHICILQALPMFYAPSHSLWLALYRMVLHLLNLVHDLISVTSVSHVKPGFYLKCYIIRGGSLYYSHFLSYLVRFFLKFHLLRLLILILHIARLFSQLLLVNDFYSCLGKLLWSIRGI